MEHDSRYTVLFTAALCVVFSVAVSTVAVALYDRQEENKRLDRIQNVLGVAGLKEPDESLSRAELTRRFESGLEARLVELQSGRYLDEGDPLSFDQRRASKDPQLSRQAPANRAKVRRVPHHGLIYLIKNAGEVAGIVVPIEGYGLWSTLYGYIALENDARTIRGITFYEHGETPGLGGEVDNPRWKALWPGRLAFDARQQLAIQVKKGRAGPVESDPHQVDGLSGATITSNGVTNMLAFWLGPEGYGPFLDEYRKRMEAL